MKKILVTGAAGFVGKHMVRCLEDRGFECIGLTHSRMDITDIGAIRDGIAGIRHDIVVHCAAISSTAYAREHPEESMAVNVAGPLNLALVCRECGAGLYVMSSDQVYGGCTLDGPIAEDRSLSRMTAGAETCQWTARRLPARESLSPTPQKRFKKRLHRKNCSIPYSNTVSMALPRQTSGKSSLNMRAMVAGTSY